MKTQTHTHTYLSFVSFKKLWSNLIGIIKTEIKIVNSFYLLLILCDLMSIEKKSIKITIEQRQSKYTFRIFEG